jgi:hypothetical protein
MGMACSPCIVNGARMKHFRPFLLAAALAVALAAQAQTKHVHVGDLLRVRPGEKVPSKARARSTNRCSPASRCR